MKEQLTRVDSRFSVRTISAPRVKLSAVGTFLLRAVQYGLLILLALIMLTPFLWMFSTSLKTDEYVLQSKPQLIPNPITFDSYIELFEIMPVGRMLLNSIIVSVVGTTGQVLMAAMAAYAFARMQWRGRQGLFLLYLATMMIPSQVTIIPLFILVRRLGWMNTYQALIVPSLFSAFATFLLRQSFLTIPRDLEEAAFIDGGNHFTVFRRIILPLSGPVLATLSVFGFMALWNSYLWPLFVARVPEIMTLPVGLATLQGSNQSLTEWNLVMAGAVITVLPILVVYLLAQKWFVQGVVLSGIKA